MAISKSSAEYYNLEKVAEVLAVPTAEVNRLREQSKIRGFRDGTDWKFLKEDIHNYLAQTIKARSGNGNGGNKPGESDFDLLGGDASSSSFDLLVENAAPLPDDDQLVAVTSRPSSDLDLAALDNDELSLAEETRISAVVVPKKVTLAKEAPVRDDDDSDALTLASASESHAVALDDNESVLGAGGSSPQLGLAGDSGFDVLVAGEGEELLEVDDEKTSPVFAAEEFVLEPTAKEQIDDSESSSQVIAIDGAGFADAEQNIDPFGQADFGETDFSGFDSGIQKPSAGTSTDPFGSGVSSFPEAFAPLSTPPKPAAPVEEYSTGMLAALIAALVVMLVPGLMLIDTMVHMWSWNDPFILNSVLMDMISGVFGL